MISTVYGSVNETWNDYYEFHFIKWQRVTCWLERKSDKNQPAQNIIALEKHPCCPQIHMFWTTSWWWHIMYPLAIFQHQTKSISPSLTVLLPMDVSSTSWRGWQCSGWVDRFARYSPTQPLPLLYICTLWVCSCNSVLLVQWTCAMRRCWALRHTQLPGKP